jgi:hypothetical protein
LASVFGYRSTRQVPSLRRLQDIRMSADALRVRMRQQWILQSHAAARIVDAGPFAFCPGVFFSESRSTIHATAGTLRNDLGALPSRYRAVVCAPDAGDTPRSRSLRRIVLDRLTRSAVVSHVDRLLTELPWPSIPLECPRFDWTPPSADGRRVSSAMPRRRRRSTHARCRGYACVMSQTSDRGLRSLLKHCTA